MKFPNLHIIWTECKNLALPDLLSRTIDEEHFTKSRDTTVEIPDNIKFFFTKTPFANNLECKYSICYNTNQENSDKTRYPALANIHKNYFEINIDKNETTQFHLKNTVQKQKQISYLNTNQKLKIGNYQ